MRIPLSKKTRFDTFKRDLFQCQYCGKTPPSVVLEIDHIKPVSKGGSNVIENLITACFDCNRGKSANELSVVPMGNAQKTELLLEKELQYLEYQKIQKKINKRIRKECELISETYSKYFTNYELNDRFLDGSVKMFIEKIGFKAVNDSMISACSKIRLNENQAIKYFCGICWTKIKEM